MSEDLRIESANVNGLARRTFSNSNRMDVGRGRGDGKDAFRDRCCIVIAYPHRRVECLVRRHLDVKASVAMDGLNHRTNSTGAVRMSAPV